MRCTACAFDNPDGMKFCGACGAPLQRPCPQCDFANPPQFKFCGRCGASLTGPPAASQNASGSPPPASAPRASPDRIVQDAERRHLTVMFCDLVNSTALAGQIDPEDLRTVVRAYQTLCADVIARFEGHIAQYLGDGLLVYFGYPLAHEDDACRAVQAGLAIMDGMAHLNNRMQQEYRLRLGVRIGIHTGLAVIGEVGGGNRQEQLALGETPNIAARIEATAEPDTVSISGATYRLVHQVFTCQAVGETPLKGVAAPIPLYRVIQEKTPEESLTAATTAYVTPLVGREMEEASMAERWAEVTEGRGQVVLISGEAGIGKSRLIRAAKDLVGNRPSSWLECRCSPYHQHSALHPVIDFWTWRLDLRDAATPDEKLDRLKDRLSRYTRSAPEALPLFAGLLDIPLKDRVPFPASSPEQQRRKTLETMLAVLLEMAASQPLFFVAEDLQWADPSTLEFLTLLVDQAPTASILAVFTFRPDFIPPWTDRPHVRHLSLHRLGRKQAVTLLMRLTGDKRLPPEVLDQIVSKTDGVPLFVEELTKMVVESGMLLECEDRYELTGPLPPLAIPDTLHDSLMARLDRLATAKEIAQVGAIIGRSFSYEMVQAILGLPSETLQPALERLVKAELLFQRGGPPRATYAFKHGLIQEVAYQSLLKSTRQQYHQRIAGILEAQFPETVEAQPELLAQHYTAAGLSEQAIAYWKRAGERATQRSAHAEAVAHFRAGLDVLTHLPDTPDREKHELEFQLALGPVVMALRGQASSEVERVYSRARTLCLQLGDEERLFPALWGLWRFHLNRAELQTAQAVGEQLLDLAQSTNNEDFHLEASMAMGATLYMQGEFVAARTHVERGIALYDPAQHHRLAFLYGGCDPSVYCLSYDALILWFLGYPDQALQKGQDAITSAQRLSHVSSLASTMVFTSYLHHFHRDQEALERRAEAIVELSTQHGFAYWLAAGTMTQGYLLAQQSAYEEGIAQIRQGLNAAKETAEELIVPFFLSLVADLYRRAGQVDEALTVVAEALAIIERTGERWWEAELYRLNGVLFMQKDDIRAETSLHRALDVARRQHAKSLELRATTSLSRLWAQQGRRREARDPLAAACDWFTEGFESPDFKEAKALLDTLM